MRLRIRCAHFCRLESDAAVPDDAFSRIAPCDHYRACWSSDGLVGNGVIEIDFGLYQRVKVGRVRGTVETVGANKIPA